MHQGAISHEQLSRPFGVSQTRLDALRRFRDRLYRLG
jgi:hypothetical protein